MNNVRPVYIFFYVYTLKAVSTVKDAGYSWREREVFVARGRVSPRILPSQAGHHIFLALGTVD